MTDDRPPAFAVDAAQEQGAVAGGAYRVVVLESSGQLTVTDVATLERAEEYANDGPPSTRPS
jgi:hypothetical protein